MKPVIAFVFLLRIFTSLSAQTPEDLARDVKENASSIAALRNVIEKHAARKDTVTYWAYKEDTAGFFQQQKLFQSFTYRVPSGKDSMTRYANLYVTYTNDQVRYIKLELYHLVYRDVIKGMTYPIYYADTVYTDSLLSNYNAKHKTNFTIADLYEDDCRRFCIITRPASVNYYPRASGTGMDTVFHAPEFSEFWPMIRDRDHTAIIKNCKSFNTTRKAYGAFCLYILQRQSEPLSREEKELLMKILNSTEKIDHQVMCRNNPDTEIKKALTPEALKDMYSYLYEGK